LELNRPQSCPRPSRAITRRGASVDWMKRPTELWRTWGRTCSVKKGGGSRKENACRKGRIEGREGKKSPEGAGWTRGVKKK